MLCDRNGNFRFAELAPGTYSVRVSAPGLAAWKMDRVIVEVGRVTLLAPKLTLAYGDNTAPANEHGSQPDLSPAVSSNIDQQALDSLPSSSGQWSGLAALSAGSAPAGEDNALSFRGLSPLMNSITIDGADHNLAFSGRQRGSSGNGYSTTQAAINEFQVNTSNFSSEYGHAAGGIINTRHPKRYQPPAWAGIFLRSRRSLGRGQRIHHAHRARTRLASMSVFLTSPPTTACNGAPPPEVRFATTSSSGSSPTISTSATFPALPAPTSLRLFLLRPPRRRFRRSRVGSGRAPAQALVAWNSTVADLNGQLGDVPRTARQLILFPKIDWRPNNRNQVVVQYNFMRRTALNSAATQTSDTYGIGSFGTSRTNSDAAIAGWEYFATPNLLNNARYQYSRELISQLAGAPTPFEQQFADNTLGLPPQIAVNRSSGFTFGTRSSLDKPPYPDETRQQFIDAVTWIHHKHAIKFGYDYNYVTDTISGLNNQAGDYSYSSILNFVSDLVAPNHCDGTTTGAGLDPCYSYYEQAIGEPSWTFETADYAAFIADDWKLARRFTISLGVRYEYEDLPSPTKLLANPDIPQTAVMPHDRNNFGPRAGFAWDIFGSGRTVLRGGYGIYYGRISNATIYSALTTTGSAHAQRSYYFRPLDTGAPPFPYVFSSGAYLVVAPNAIYFDKRFQNPQIDQTELSLQQELGHRTALTLTYMGSYARELPNFIDTNVDLNALGVLNYTIEDPQHLGPIKSALMPAASSTSASIRPTARSPTSPARPTPVIRPRSSASCIVSPAHLVSMPVTHTRTPSTTIRTNPPSPTTTTSTTPPTSASSTAPRTSTCVSVLQAASSRKRPGVSADSPAHSSTATRWAPQASGALASLTPCAPPEPFPRPPAPTRSISSPDRPAWPSTISGVILGGADSGPRISGLGASLNGYGGNDIIPQVGRNTFRYPGVVNWM